MSNQPDPPIRHLKQEYGGYTICAIEIEHGVGKGYFVPSYAGLKSPFETQTHETLHGTPEAAIKAAKTIVRKSNEDALELNEGMARMAAHNIEHLANIEYE